MASSDDHDGPPCAPGTVVDRYIVLDCLGQRGAGTAYVAHDPKLDRKVALELLPLEDAHLEQARAIAKLARPHVVQVLHVGTFRDQLFLVTEFVDGPNLREWLRLRDRRPKEILDIFVEAGRGLAAVHAAGLVHGDFKPDDVLVGEDGRARVTDFGRGHPGASALADQIRFCVSLDEALQGKRPPRWLRDVLARGLHEAPERRYPSMDALLAELTRERRGRPRVLALTAVVLFLAIAGFLWRARGASGPPVCAGPEQKLSGIWDDARKEAISRAFSATGKPYAADAWGGVQTTLDAYTRAWGAQFTEACHAMHDRSGTSADIRDVRDLRMTCLAERVDEVKALTNIFVNADGEVVTGAFGAAQQLTGLATCSDTKALTALVKPPSDQAVAAKVDEIRKQMTEIKAMLDAGKYREVLPSAAKAVEAARATGYGPIQGEALMWYGEAQGRAGLNEAEATFYEAAWAADRSGDDRTRGRVWGDLLYYVAYGRAQPEKIPFFYEQGMAAISRLGGDDALQEELFNSYGAATNAARQFDTARTANEQALALAERLYGPESTQVAVITSNLANTYLLQGAYDLALVRYQRALAIIERVLGSRHPFVAGACDGLGVVQNEMLQSKEAEATLRRAMDIDVAALGPTHPQIVNLSNDLGFTLSTMGSYAQALEQHRRAIAILEKESNERNPNWFYSLWYLGEAHLGLGENERAMGYLERALKLREAASALEGAQAQFALARALAAASRDRGRARKLAAAAREVFEKEARSPREQRTLARIKAF